MPHMHLLLNIYYYLYYTQYIYRLHCVVAVCSLILNSVLRMSLINPVMKFVQMSTTYNLKLCMYRELHPILL